jgi:NADPH2:quinone reductase
MLHLMKPLQRMKFVDLPQPGGPEVLVVAELDVPECGADQVLIKAEAAGLNRADLLQRRGHYPPPNGAPTYPGLEVAGTIVARGAAVHDFKEGDRVCALLQGGGYAQYCVIDAGQVLPIPFGLTSIEAASLPEAYFTVFSNVFMFGRLQGDETLLVHGGSSGIGVAAIQLARALGHEVFATAGSDAKCQRCEQLGARMAINYKEQDFVEVVRSATDQRGVDVILDMVGGHYLARNLRTLATQGRLVMIATQGGAKAELDILHMMQRRLSVTGSTLRGRSAEFKRTVRDQLLRIVWPLIEAGKIKPVVDRVFPMRDASGAHAYMESGAHQGKIILEIE